MTTNYVHEMAAELLTDSHALQTTIKDVVEKTPVIDMHTHLFAPPFGKLSLWGIDEVITYHYLIAELFRSSHIRPEKFWSLSKSEQADAIWDALFVQNTPVSEATRGVVTVMSALGLDARASDLKEAREFFRSQKIDDIINRVFSLANVNEVVMTNDPFDDEEASIWETGLEVDARFHAALRLDPLLLDWTDTAEKLNAKGYRTHADFSGETIKEARRFLDLWIDRMKPLYLAVSLPDDFTYPSDSTLHQALTRIVLPTCREHDIPFAEMIGVKRRVNPAIRIAGDGVGRADVGAVERLCLDFPDNRFLVTMLSRENQHQLCVAARKFSNLMPFGCWWFMNNPSIINEITSERVELLGTSFIPQHSDARVLEQLIYKWKHSRAIIASVLYDSYNRLLESGRAVSKQEIERDVTRLFSGNFRTWVGL